MVVPRVKRDYFEGQGQGLGQEQEQGSSLMSVNGFGFIGMMLVRVPDNVDAGVDKGQGGQIHALMERNGGPLAVLNAVTSPAVNS